jgi:C4-type Zn-finger protein
MRIIDGNIFEGMRIILPEHREAMSRLETESKKQPRPVLDEQKIEEMARMLADAIQDQRPITVIVYKPFGPDRVEIVPEKIDPYSKQLKGKDREGNVRIVPLTDLIDVQV